MRIEPGMTPVGACDGVVSGSALAERSGVDVAVVDYQLSDGHGLQLALRFARMGIRTLVYSAYDDRRLAPASLVAGAVGVLHKSNGGDKLCDGVRSVARDIPVFPPLDREVLESCVERLDTRDLPIFGMMMERTTRQDVAQAARVDEQELDERLEEMVERLRPPTHPLARLER